jgi:hypothetical protein
MTPEERDEQIRVRIAQDIMQRGMVAYWLARAETFEAARPRPGDWMGNLSPAAVADQDKRLADLAQLCRDHARACELDEREAVA